MNASVQFEGARIDGRPSVAPFKNVQPCPNIASTMYPVFSVTQLRPVLHDNES
jgi:hypothetical protein